jgi:formate hydrogenlyase transcriptional activator
VAKTHREENNPVTEIWRAWQRSSVTAGKQSESIPNETMDALSRYSWPGNIRELQNLMERAVLLSIGPLLRVPLGEIVADSGLNAASGDNALKQTERERIVRALRASNWVVGGAHGAAARLSLKGRRSPIRCGS